MIIMYAKLYIEFREQNNLYQYQLAEMLDVSVPYMSRLERGEAKPSASLCEKTVHLLSNAAYKFDISALDSDLCGYLLNSMIMTLPETFKHETLRTVFNIVREVNNLTSGDIYKNKRK